MPQYQRSVVIPLPEATSDTRVLTQWGLRVLKRIYRPGFGYHKAGVTLLNLTKTTNQQFTLLSGGGGAGDVQSKQLMGALDAINARYGRGTLRLAAEGIEKSWKMRRGNLSPGYTTDWHGLPVVRAK